MIKMTKYAKRHEALIKKSIEEGSVSGILLEYHQQRIAWLQHERLVHLLVLILAVIGLITFFVLSMFVHNFWVVILACTLLVLSGFYVAHYYFLENTVQRWYRLADEMVEVITPIKK